MAFVTRYLDDPSRPTIPSALRDRALRTLLPAVGLCGVLVGLGKDIEGPLKTLGLKRSQSTRPGPAHVELPQRPCRSLDGVVLDTRPHGRADPSTGARGSR